jgi:hypothetical protein
LKTETLARIGGIAIIPASAVALLGLIAQGAHIYEQAGGFAELVGGVVLVMALPALVVRMATRAGRLGLAGSLLVTFVVLDFQVIGGALDAFVVPMLAAHGISTKAVPPALGIFFLLGVVAQLPGTALLAYATIRRRPLPILAGWLWAASLLAAIIGFLPSAGVFDVVSGALAYCGLIVAGASLAFGGRHDAVAVSPGPAPATA